MKIKFITCVLSRILRKVRALAESKKKIVKGTRNEWP
jgi:hypothetical protein